MNIFKVFDAIEKVELKISELYKYFNKLFTDEKGAAALFFRMSLDEQSHADLIKYQRRLARQNKNLSKDIEMDISRVDKLISEIDNIIGSHKPLSLGEAIKLSIEIENDIMEYHGRHALIKTVPEVAELLKNLFGEDHKHIELLKELAKYESSK